MAEDRGDKEVRDGGDAANQTRLEAARRIFTRILVGVDGSQQALEAARQAALLQDVDGRLTLLAVWDIAHGVGGTGNRIPHYVDEDFQRTAAEKGLRAATGYVAPYTAASPSSCAARPWPRSSPRSSATKTR